MHGRDSEPTHMLVSSSNTKACTIPTRQSVVPASAPSRTADPHCGRAHPYPFGHRYGQYSGRNLVCGRPQRDGGRLPGEELHRHERLVDPSVRSPLPHHIEAVLAGGTIGTTLLIKH